jgi:arabinose-5-phosphate isomerase
MIQGADIPKVTSGATFAKALREMDEKNKGFILITDRKNQLLGILTDGDLRRLIRRGENFENRAIDEFMTRSPKTIEENTSVARTIETMQQQEITTLAVVNEKKQLKGYVHLHDILGRGGTLQISIS